MEKLQVAFEILKYLAEHPQAQDTLEGIVQWWLPEPGIKRPPAQVGEALAELVGKGLMLERKGCDAQSHYRMNRRKAKEIRTLLKRRSG